VCPAQPYIQKEVKTTVPYAGQLPRDNIIHTFLNTYQTYQSSTYLPVLTYESGAVHSHFDCHSHAVVSSAKVPCDTAPGKQVYLKKARNTERKRKEKKIVPESRPLEVVRKSSSPRVVLDDTCAWRNRRFEGSRLRAG
jgi:hypothetical protein